MAKPIFLDPATGARRQREQRPDGEGTKYRIVIVRDALLPDAWEMYHCLAEGCVFDTQWSEAFDLHYFYKHEAVAAREQALADAMRRERERAARMKERPEIPILGR